jgi:hypothetical protein
VSIFMCIVIALLITFGILSPPKYFKKLGTDLMMYCHFMLAWKYSFLYNWVHTAWKEYGLPNLNIVAVLDVLDLQQVAVFSEFVMHSLGPNPGYMSSPSRCCFPKNTS